MAVGNDFRQHFEGREGFDVHTGLESPAGMVDWMLHLASFGYLSGYVGDGGFDVVPKEGGFDIVDGLPEDEEGASVHHVSTELWWFAILDGADFQADAKDSYDREVGFIDIEPGTYTMMYHLEYAERLHEGFRVWAEIRKAPVVTDPC
jgi:hypothetical protein